MILVFIYANIQLYKGLITMEMQNDRIKSALQNDNSSSVFIHKHTFYGKFTHLRRGIRRIPSKGNKTKINESNMRFLTEPSKSFCFNNHFKRNKPKQEEKNQFVRNSKTVNLNRKNAYFSTDFIGNQLQKISPSIKRDIDIINGHQVWAKQNKDIKMITKETNPIRQLSRPLSIIKVILSKNKGNFKEKQHIRGIQQRSKTLPNNFQQERTKKQTSLKTTSIQSVTHQPQTEFADNQNIIIEVNSPKQSKSDLQQRYKQSILNRKTKVLIIQKTQVNHLRMEQQRHNKKEKRKSKKITDIIKIDSDNLVGPWSKKPKFADQDQQIFIN